MHRAPFPVWQRARFCPVHLAEGWPAAFEAFVDAAEDFFGAG